jgi:centromere-localized protein 2
MHGPKDDENLTAVHSERSIVKEMEVACDDIQQEIYELERDASDILSELSDTVGGLSDLRYGKFAKASGSAEEFGPEVLQGIKRLQEVCEDARMSRSNG